MRLPRLQLWEVEDQPWWPLWLRDYQTDVLEQIQRWMRFYDGGLPFIQRLLEQQGESGVLDLCSGGGGPWPDWFRRGLVRGPVCLSDLYPNRQAFARLEADYPGLSGHGESLNILELGPDPPGVRTMFTALHHLPPEGVRQLLVGISESGRALAAFDFNQRSWLTLSLVAPLAWLACWLLTPWLRPSWHRLWWTYVIPVVPLALAWDGLVSQLRAYRTDELRALVPPAKDYRWEVGTFRCKGLCPVTFLLGFPQRQSPSNENDAQK